ncbi:MAG: zinc transporter ZntB [Marinagarivorans sp.]|nr:zinc transporter ZntB [Marinagarivorans sp.]
MGSIRENGLVCAYVINAQEQATAIALSAVDQWQPSQGYLWLHFDIREQAAREWITHRSHLPDVAINTLLTEETRPHVWREGEALVMALRGVNLNPASVPEDMVAVRLYADKHKIITTRRRSLMSLKNIAARAQNGEGPASVSDLVAELTGQLTSQLIGAIDSLEDAMDGLEEVILDEVKQQRRVHVLELRRKCILLRRYLAPQREALARLYLEPIGWMDERQRMRQRNIADQLVRYVDALDVIKDRAAVVQEELSSRVADQLNNRMYILSVVAALFLPLGFILNVFNLPIDGSPLVARGFGSLMLLGSMVVAVVVQIIIFKRKGWF